MKIKKLWFAIYDRVYHHYHNFTTFFYRAYKTVERFLYWGWTLRYSYDWDFMYLEEMMLLKLKRIRKYCVEQGHLVWDQSPEEDEFKSLKSLDLAIALLERLTTRSDIMYAIHTEKKHEDKWGRLEFDFKRKDSLFRTKRSNVKTPEDEEKEREESRKIFDLSFKIYNRDRKWFYNIMYKYGRHWWD